MSKQLLNQAAKLVMFPNAFDHVCLDAALPLKSSFQSVSVARPLFAVGSVLMAHPFAVLLYMLQAHIPLPLD